MYFLRLPCIMYGRTIMGRPPSPIATPINVNTFLWQKSFIIKPSWRNNSTVRLSRSSPTKLWQHKVKLRASRHWSDEYKVCYLLASSLPLFHEIDHHSHCFVGSLDLGLLSTRTQTDLWKRNMRTMWREWTNHVGIANSLILPCSPCMWMKKTWPSLKHTEGLLSLEISWGTALYDVH